MLERSQTGTAVFLGHRGAQHTQRAEPRPEPARKTHRRDRWPAHAARSPDRRTRGPPDADRPATWILPPHRPSCVIPTTSRAQGARYGEAAARPVRSPGGTERGCPTGHERRPRLGRVPGQRRRHARPGGGAPVAAGTSAAGRWRSGHAETQSAGQAARARAGRTAARSRNDPAGTVAARRGGDVRGRGAGGGHRHRHRPGPWFTLRDRRQRRHRQGRHVLPADGEEAPAGAGDRDGEPPAVHLPGRLRRRLPAAAGRGLPRPRPLRAHLLQPGAHVGRGHPPDRGRHGLVHGRRRLRPRDVRRDGDRARHRHDLPRRPAAREGRHGRGGDAPRSWAEPTCTPAGAASPTTRRRRRPRAAIVREIVRTSIVSRRPRRGRSAEPTEPGRRPDELYGVVPDGPRRARTTCAR